MAVRAWFFLSAETAAMVLEAVLAAFAMAMIRDSTDMGSPWSG
jgi:hypothetical protein